MKLEFNDTVYYHKRKGQLVQQIDIIGDMDSNWLEDVEALVETDNFGSFQSKVEKKGDGYRCFAPVVYPNFVNNVHTPVIARISLIKNKQIIHSNTVCIGNFRPWTIYIASDCCTDYTWGNGYEDTRILSSELISKNLEAMKATDGEPFESQHRWNMNQTVELEWFLENASQEEIDELFRREKQNRIQISPTYNSNLTGCLSTEQAIRSLTYARELEMKYGIKIDTLEHIEMPTITWGMMSIYAAAGIKHFIKAWLDFNSPYLRRSDDVSLFYWKGPDDKAVLTFCDRKSNLKWGYAPGYFIFSGMSYEDCITTLHNWFINNYETNKNYPYDAIILNGTHCDLHEVTLSQPMKLAEFIAKYQKEEWEYPKLVNANWRHFFNHVEESQKRLGVTIPYKKGDSGVSWEDWPAHYANIYAKFKAGAEKYFSAEKLIVMAMASGKQIHSQVKSDASEGIKYMNLLAEHPWNGSNDDEKRRSMKKRNEWANKLYEISEKMESYAVSEGNEAIYNTLSWDRTVPVETSDGVLFSELPAFGYTSSVFEPKKKVFAHGNTIENDFYKITVSYLNGAIDSIIDKKNGNRQLVKDGSFVNQYVYESERIPFGITQAGIQAVNEKGKSTLIITGRGYQTRLETRIVLYSDIDQIDIHNKLHKEPSEEPLNVKFMFDFNVDGGKFHFDNAGAVIRPGLLKDGGDMLLGSGQEFYSARNFINYSNNDFGITLSPKQSYMFMLGKNGYDESLDRPSGDLIQAVVLTNHAYQEILRDQGGNKDFTFDFSIQTHKGAFSAINSYRFGNGHNNPPVFGKKLISSEETVSFIHLEAKSTVITAVKPSFEEGIAVRLWNLGIETDTVSIDISAFNAKLAVKADILERKSEEILPINDGKVTIDVPARGFASFIFK